MRRTREEEGATAETVTQGGGQVVPVPISALSGFISRRQHQGGGRCCRRIRKPREEDGFLKLYLLFAALRRLPDAFRDVLLAPSVELQHKQAQPFRNRLTVQCCYAACACVIVAYIEAICSFSGRQTKPALCLVRRRTGAREFFRKIGRKTPGGPL